MFQPLEIINPLSYQGWDEVILSNKNYSFFHSSAWARVLHESYQYKPLYFTIIKDNKIHMLIPCMEVHSILTGKRGVSLPFSDVSDSIIVEPYKTKEILKHLIQYGKENGWKYIEIRSSDIFPQEIQSSSLYIGHILNLSNDIDKTFSKFRSSTKRNIRKSIKEGVEVSVSNSMEALKEFHRLNCLTRKGHGLPPQPFHFFKKVYEHIIAHGFGVVVLASYKQMNIAGAVFFNLGAKAIFKYGASDMSFQHLRPNNLVMWEAIKWYSQNGYQQFFFGRTNPENKGLIQYKTGWGTQEYIIKYYKYDLGKCTFVKDRGIAKGRHNWLFNKMPELLLKFTGKLLYRHIG